MNDILINPKVPKWMDCKDIEDRSSSHLEKWWNVPYIVFETFEKEPYNKFIKRLKKMNMVIDERFEDYEIRKKEEFLSWIKKWNNGIRYDVRMLDGGAWDRTTWKGSFDTVDKAIEYCKNLKKLV